MKNTIKIAHLYFDIFNNYGDGGNLLALKKRCEAYNIVCSIDKICVNDSLSEKYDMYFLASEKELDQFNLPKLDEHKKIINNAIQNNAIILGLGGGYQLLGETYTNSNNVKIEGLGLLNIYTISNKKRFSGNVTLLSNIEGIKNLVGYENHTSLTYLKDNASPLGTTIIGNGNNGTDNTEGAFKGRIFGTYLYGSFLPNNVSFTDYLISLALNEDLIFKDNDLEIKTHEALIGKAY